jgi:hypothetical protein
MHLCQTKNMRRNGRDAGRSGAVMLPDDAVMRTFSRGVAGILASERFEDGLFNSKIQFEMQFRNSVCPLWPVHEHGLRLQDSKPFGTMIYQLPKLNLRDETVNSRVVFAAGLLVSQVASFPRDFVVC